ncbi:MAG TPA: hypothetical protein DEQ34_10505 [Balneolaceae bacterium]|nr:hypothetical protein [Balneolaceae bacterium]|tara:strand:+ start:67529 stop:68191 length:663 start_codon:yes stop_codon:yes gene_type:complete
MQNKLIGFFLLIALLVPATQSKAQTVEILAGNTLNGALNGTLLGGASMALTNSDDFYPLQVGLGLGTLYGIGMGAFDVVQGGGKPVLVSGLFNDGNNSSIIVLLDTFYGAAAGSIIVTSVMLVANEPLLDGLQYGAGIGAFVGFGFGVFDTFFLSERMTGFASNYSPGNTANGLMALNFDDQYSVGLINPTVYQTLDISGNNISSSINAGVDLVHVRVNF